MSDNNSNPEDEYRITDPVDLVGAIPYLLGYRVPERSLVVIGFHGPRLVCTFRTELTPFVVDFYDDLAVRLRRNDCTAVIMICFGGQPLAEAAEAVATAALDAEGIAIGDAMRVTGERLWCLRCTNCPRQGLEIPETTPSGVALAVHGRTVAPDRDVVLQRLDPIGGPRAADVAAALYDAQRHWAGLGKAERALAAVERFDTAFIAQPDALAAEPEIVADLLVAMADARTRVLAYRQIAPAIARDCLETWLIAARLASGTDSEAAALCVAGYCAYQAGEGFLAAEAFERARKADESCMDAWAYLDAYHQGVPPTQVEVFAPLGDA